MSNYTSKEVLILQAIKKDMLDLKNYEKYNCSSKEDFDESIKGLLELKFIEEKTKTNTKPIKNNIGISVDNGYFITFRGRAKLIELQKIEDEKQNSENIQ